MPYGEALMAPTYYILSRRENYVWDIAFTYGGTMKLRIDN